VAQGLHCSRLLRPVTVLHLQKKYVPAILIAEANGQYECVKKALARPQVGSSQFHSYWTECQSQHIHQEQAKPLQCENALFARQMKQQDIAGLFAIRRESEMIHGIQIDWSRSASTSWKNTIPDFKLRKDD